MLLITKQVKLVYQDHIKERKYKIIINRCPFNLGYKKTNTFLKNYIFNYFNQTPIATNELKIMSHSSNELWLQFIYWHMNGLMKNLCATQWNYTPINRLQSKFIANIYNPIPTEYMSINWLQSKFVANIYDLIHVFLNAFWFKIALSKTLCKNSSTRSKYFSDTMYILQRQQLWTFRDIKERERFLCEAINLLKHIPIPRPIVHWRKFIPIVNFSWKIKLWLMTCKRAYITWGNVCFLKHTNSDFEVPDKISLNLNFSFLYSNFN